LMDELAAKVAKEGEVEQAAYEEYFAWCDDVNKNSHFAIKTAATQKEKLEAKIGELTANIQAGESKIADLAAGIATATAELEKATEIREKETADFASSEEELVATVDTVGRAIKIIEKEMNKNPASFAQVASKGFVSVMNSLSTIVDAAGLSSSDQHRLTALVQSQQSSSDDDSELGAPAAASYTSKSGGIVDTLEDLKEKADTELAEMRKAESDAKHNFEMLKQSLSDQLDADNKDLDSEKTDKAAAQEDKATAEGDLSVTSGALTNAQGELETANKNCMQVAADHGATVASRNEELKVIAEATQIVKDSTGGASAQTYSLLQVSGASHVELARSEIVTLVKSLARKQHSAGLAQLASRITAVMRYGSTGGDDPFVKVKGLINDMIAKLEKEAAEAADEKKFCDEEMGKTKAKKDDLDSTVEKLTTKINQDSSKSVELKNDVKELESELAALASEQAEMDKMRQKNHAEFVQAKKDLELGLGGVRKALGVLREYYGGGASLLQDTMEQPAMPKGHSKSGGAGGSIINLLEVCESDFASNLAKEETEEATRAEAYEQNTQENKVTKTSSEQDIKYKTQEAIGLDKAVAEISGDRDTTNTELSAVNEYWGQLKARCIAKPETYEERKRRREAEVAGLKEALTVLENEAALIQSGARKSRHMRGALAAGN